ncbi:MAG: hypothetical protein FD173_1833 [Gallionellaceae bacterium]|nr:MAG: hypothetical protein FD173_1833 [Gallionellaceae bacterium]
MLIKNNALVADEWIVLRLKEGEAADSVTVPAGNVIVPLPVWNCQHEALQGRKELGLWLAGFERAEDIPDDVHRFPVIAVDFHKYTDGRGYTLAYRLRNQYGYRGELRAMGDILRDQLFYLKRVGFDTFAVRADTDIRDALKGLSDFSLTYQASTDNAQPLYRREKRGAAR